MNWRVNITVEVDQVGNGLAIQTPVPLQLICNEGRWQATCVKPAVTTEEHGNMEEAIVAGAKAVRNELQAAVIDRPIVAGKITPEQVPVHF